MAATRKLQVLLEVEVVPMTEEQLQDAGYYEFSEDDEAPYSLDEFDVSEFGFCVAEAVMLGREEMFAGSDVFAGIGQVKAVSAKWGE